MPKLEIGFGAALTKSLSRGPTWTSLRRAKRAPGGGCGRFSRSLIATFRVSGFAATPDTAKPSAREPVTMKADIVTISPEPMPVFTVVLGISEVAPDAKGRRLEAATNEPSSVGGPLNAIGSSAGRRTPEAIVAAAVAVVDPCSLPDDATFSAAVMPPVFTSSAETFAAVDIAPAIDDPPTVAGRLSSRAAGSISER